MPDASPYQQPRTTNQKSRPIGQSNAQHEREAAPEAEFISQMAPIDDTVDQQWWATFRLREPRGMTTRKRANTFRGRPGTGTLR